MRRRVQVEKMNKEQREALEEKLSFDAWLEAYDESVSRKEYEEHLKEAIRDERSRGAARSREVKA